MKVKTYEVVDRALDTVTENTSARGIEHVRGMIEDNAQLAAADFLADCREKFEQARAELETLQTRLQARRERFQEALAQLAASPAGDPIRAVLFLAGAAACFITEVTLSLSLPYLLDVPERSFLAKMMGVALASAVLILDWVADKLGFKVSPWALLKSTILSRFWRVAACVVSIAVLVAVAGLNLYTISTMTPTREEAAKVRQNVASPETPPIPVDEETVSRAVWWFSISVTIGAALLLLVGSAELRKLGRRGIIKTRIHWHEWWDQALTDQTGKARAVFEARQAEWAHAPPDALHAADLIRQQHLLRLEQAILPKPKPKRSALEIVEAALQNRRPGEITTG